MESQATSGKDAYEISLTRENLIGEGNQGDVYKVLDKHQNKVHAAKFLKVPLDCMDSEDRLGYERELEILQDITHPFII